MKKYNVTVKVSAPENKPVVLNVLYIPPDGYSIARMKADVAATVFSMAKKRTQVRGLNVEIVSFRVSRIDCIIQH